VYGTGGGAGTLEERGVTFAGDLPAAKARVALALGLAADLDGAPGGGEIEALFEPA
jgi:L-asparaginase